MTNIANRYKADVAQRKEQGSSKAKVAGSSPAVSAKSSWTQDKQDMVNAIVDETVAMVNAKILQKHKERLAYNAAYQRDLRTIKRLGLEMTVAEWRKTNAPYEK